MRLIDGDTLYDKAEAWYKGATTPFREIYRSFIDIIVDAPTIEPEPNDPLTIEQLQQMAWGPVWIEKEDGEGGWTLIRYCNQSGILTYGCGFLAFDSYKINWIAYRRKLGPEQFPVVHCKGCKHLYFKDFSAFCPHRVGACRPEGFCECGERRE